MRRGFVILSGDEDPIPRRSAVNLDCGAPRPPPKLIPLARPEPRITAATLRPGRATRGASQLRCAMLPPAAVPYREPLLAALAAREELCLRVVFQAQQPAGWDMDQGWYATDHDYDAAVLGALQWARSGRTPIMLSRGLWRALERFAPDVVVAWEFGPAALVARAWCSRRRRALVHFSELGAPAAHELPAAQRRLHGALLRRAAGAIGASTQARERLVGLGAPPLRTVMSLQSVDADSIRTAAAARPTRPPGDPLRLLCVARLTPEKNIAALIRAAASTEPGALELDVIGDGPLRAELQSLAASVPSTVRFHRAVSPAEMAQAYASADAFALISHYEPFGVALREAVAAGLPLIASTRAGATGDIAIAGRNALVVDPGDHAAIAAAVHLLTSDPARRIAMAQASGEIDAEWPLERSVDAFARAVLLARG